MTARTVYEAVLVEINKENSQSFTTEEFNYILNKAILAFENDKYNFYTVNQQTSDDLRVFIKNQTFSMLDTTDVVTGDNTVAVFNPTTSHLLTSISATTTAVLTTARDLTVTDVIRFGAGVTLHTILTIAGNTITFTGAATVAAGETIFVSNNPIPVPDNDTTGSRIVDINFTSSDYLHLLSCRILWKNKRPSTDETAHLIFPAKKATYDMLNAIQNNSYLNPAPNRPYYQLFDHVSNSGAIPFASADYKAHQNRPRVKVHIGNKNNFMELRSIEFDYLKTPETVTLYDSDIFSASVDTSQVLELPDYLLNEIVKRCTAYLLEKSSDPRMQTQPAFNQEIPSVPVNIMMGNSASKQQSDKQ